MIPAASKGRIEHTDTSVLTESAGSSLPAVHILFFLQLWQNINAAVTYLTAYTLYLLIYLLT